jgi:hypothetical protein
MDIQNSIEKNIKYHIYVLLCFFHMNHPVAELFFGAGQRLGVIMGENEFCKKIAHPNRPLIGADRRHGPLSWPYG